MYHGYERNDNMSKILFMNASPNKEGATASIAHELLKGKDYEEMQMSDYEISQYGAVRDNDQIKEMLSVIGNYDTLLIGSPVYFYTISGILKTFIDRLYLLPEAEILKGKKVYFFAQGYRPDDETIKTIHHLMNKASLVINIDLKQVVVDTSDGTKIISELNIQ